MKSKTTNERSPIDTAKLGLSALLLVAGIAFFYYYDDEIELLYRVLALLGAAVAAGLVAMTTELGRSLFSFGREARMELRKVVWPTRQETIQTTLIVVVMVLIVAVFLWLLDMALFELFGLLMDLGD